MCKKIIETAFCLTIFSLAFMVPPQSIRAESKNQLWQKAVAISAANRIWVPGQLIEKEEVYNDDGDLEESSELHLQFVLSEKENFSIKILKAVKNGKDITEKSHDEFNENMLGQYLREDEEDNPFAPEVQQNIEIQRTNQTKTIGDKTYIAFEYKQRTKDNEWQGLAWLEAESGTPLEVKYKPLKKLPTDDGFEIKELSVLMRYKTTDDGALLVNEVIIDSKFKVKPFPFFTFNGSSQTIISLTDYWKYE